MEQPQYNLFHRKRVEVGPCRLALLGMQALGLGTAPAHHSPQRSFVARRRSRSEPPMCFCEPAPGCALCYMQEEYAPLYDAHGLGLTTWSPLASGVLTGACV